MLTSHGAQCRARGWVPGWGCEAGPGVAHTYLKGLPSSPLPIALPASPPPGATL